MPRRKHPAVPGTPAASWARRINSSERHRRRSTGCAATRPGPEGSILEFEPQGHAPFRIYITGDTLMFEGLNEIPRRHREIDLALLHLGGTRVLGILVTMDAKQGVELMKLIRPHLAIPIHFNDYDVFTSPLSDFVKEVSAAGLEDQVHYLSHGGTYSFQIPTKRIAA